MFLPLTFLALAILNSYFSKQKLEIFIILAGSVIFLHSNGLHLWRGVGPNVYLASIIGFWCYAIYMLFKPNNDYKSRLPIYTILLAKIILARLYYLEFSQQEFFGRDFYTLNNLIYNMFLLAPIIYLIITQLNQKISQLSWQYYLLFAILLAGLGLPISGLYIILFSLIYGYLYHDKFILFAGYILIPTFIIGLYYDIFMSLATASLLALFIAIGFLTAYVIVRFSKFKQVEA